MREIKTIATKVNGNTTATSGSANTNLLKMDNNNLQFITPMISTTTANASLIGSGNLNKRPASLAINKDAPLIKKRLTGPSPLILDTPLGGDKPLDTPEIEKICLSTNLIQTPQPGVIFQTKVGMVTTEQEEYARGFEDALHNLHNRENSQLNNNNNNSNQTNNSNVTNQTAVANSVSITTTTTTGTGLSGGSFTYTNLDAAFPVTIKDEPQNPSSPTAVSPIDMETQEKIKLERKRQRNRVAASKCRKRKLERISKLEDNVKLLKAGNLELATIVKNLKEHVAQLKQEVLEHYESGCTIK